MFVRDYGRNLLRSENTNDAVSGTVTLNALEIVARVATRCCVA